MSKLKSLEMHFEYIHADQSELSQDQASFMVSKFVEVMQKFFLRKLLYQIDDAGRRHVSTETSEGESLAMELQSAFTEELKRLIELYQLEGINIQLPPEVAF